MKLLNLLYKIIRGMRAVLSRWQRLLRLNLHLPDGHFKKLLIVTSTSVSIRFSSNTRNLNRR